MQKILKNLMLAAAVALTFAACSSDEPEAPKPSKPDSEVTPPAEQDKPTAQEPTYDFDTMSKTVNIDPKKTYQTVEGIGASDCWLPATIGRCWTSNRARLAEMLFSQEIVNGQPKGIGLSIWRVNLGAGTEELGDKSGINSDNMNNRAPSYWNGSACDFNRCPGQRYFMEQAKGMGVDKFVLFSNSPLVQYTKNGMGKSSNGAYANLKDDCYDKFADYMATVAQHFVSNGYNVTHISPVNEPQYNWDGSSQEGSGWQNSEVARIARALSNALDAKNVSTNISLGEAGAWDCLYEGEASRHDVINQFFTPGASAYIGDLPRVKNICAHSYYTDGNWNDMRNVRSKAAAKAAQYGVNLWQTEWSMLVNGPNHYGENLTDATTPWQVAQWMAMVIHNDFTVAGVTSWSYWTSMSVERWSQMDRFMLINCIPAGGNYSNDFTAEGRIEDFRTLWVLGNYSRFVRPGFTRIDAAMVENENFFGDAWVSPDGKQVVCVYTNRMNSRGVKLKVDYNLLGGTPKEIKTYTTTETKNLQETVLDPSWQVVLEPYSVTTVVYSL